MTWNELAEEIASLPREVLGQQARVWLPHDAEWEEFPVVDGISPFDAERPCSEDNFASIDLMVTERIADTWERIIADAYQGGYIDPDNDEMRDRLVERCKRLAKGDA